MSKLTAIYTPLLIVAATVCAFVAIIVNDSDTLFRLQEFDLFLYTPSFFTDKVTQAGGLLSYAGSYFTQFCYHPHLGAALLAAWAGLLSLLTWRTFRISAVWAPVALLPIALILMADFTIGYWMYYLKFHGHFFAGPIGFSVAVAAVWLYRSLPRTVRPAVLVLTPVVLYPLVGFYALLATVLIIIIGWRLPDLSRRWQLMSTVGGAIVAVAVPLLCYRYAFCRTNIADIWTVGLPQFNLSEASFDLHYLPYALLSVLLVILSALYKAPKKTADSQPELSAKQSELSAKQQKHAAKQQKHASKQQKHTAKQPKATGRRLTFVLHAAAVASMVWGCSRLWFRDANFHHELRMADCVERCDWQGVLDVASSIDDEPSRMMVMFKNLAVFKAGRAGDELYNYRDGSKKPAADIPVRMVQIGGKTIYVHYGVLNFCYRWCMEDGVEYGWRVDYLRQMLRCAVLNGEKALARKFADLLSHTRYYSDMGSHYLALANHPDKITADAELGPIVPLLDYDNTLSSDRAFMETFLLMELSCRNKMQPLSTELSLIAAMQLKVIPKFWPAFFRYAETHKGQHMPRHFQEAALLFGNLEHQVDISKMPFDSLVVNNYKQFMNFATKCQGMSEPQMRNAFYPRFGNTYFFNYYLYHDLTTN